jgi:hypothetical protein
MALLVACGGTEIDVGANDASTLQALVVCDGGNTTPDDAGSCYSTCCMPKVGNNSNLTSPPAAVTALVGKWELCTSFPDVPSDVIGIELDPPAGWDGGQADDGGYVEVDGNLRFLVQGQSGPQPGQGFAYESSWGLYGQGASYSMYVGGTGTPFLYAPCPQQLELQYYYDAGATGGQTADILLVPF